MQEQECQEGTENVCEAEIQDLECTVDEDSCEEKVEIVCQEVIKPVCVTKTIECSTGSSKNTNEEGGDEIINEDDGDDDQIVETNIIFMEASSNKDDKVKAKINLSGFIGGLVEKERRQARKNKAESKTKLMDALMKEFNEGKSMEVILEGMLSMTEDLNNKSGRENPSVKSAEDIFLTSGIFQGVVKEMREVRRSRMKRQTTKERKCVPITMQDCTEMVMKECRPQPKTDCSRTVSARCKPRAECDKTGVLQCKSVPRVRCRQLTRQECTTVPRRQCATITKNTCVKNTQKVCKSQVCQTKPKQFCQSVPKTSCRAAKKKCTVSPHGKCGYSRRQCGCREELREECRTVQKEVCGQGGQPRCVHHCEDVYWCNICHGYSLE